MQYVASFVEDHTHCTETFKRKFATLEDCVAGIVEQQGMQLADAQLEVEGSTVECYGECESVSIKCKSAQAAELLLAALEIEVEAAKERELTWLKG